MKKVFLINTLKLCISGLLIGLLHSYDLILAIIVVLKISRSWYIRYKKNELYKEDVLGFFITAIIGIVAEYFGTKLGLWEYHDIKYQMPLWLFFAWGSAYLRLNKIENEFLAVLPNISKNQKIGLMIFIVIYFPTLGEIIAIKLGTWTYYFPYQILGVPIAAMFVLLLIHASVKLFVEKVAVKK